MDCVLVPGRGPTAERAGRVDGAGGRRAAGAAGRGALALDGRAQAVGKPVVSFALDGSLDAVEHGVSGSLTRPHDARDLAHHVLVLLADAALRARMGQAGRAFAAAHFPVELMVRRINDVYRALARNR
jgi:glycosyltransferase involved in cell wall biosynthesis